MLRRGLTVATMREFCTAQGGSKSVNLMEMDKLWTINKKLIDAEVPRFTAIDKEVDSFFFLNFLISNFFPPNSECFHDDNH
jgi:glutamyl/glutaminyl-tRNA synthetase